MWIKKLKAQVICISFMNLQVVIGIGAKPAVSPFDMVGLNKTVGGIEVSTLFISMLGFI